MFNYLIFSLNYFILITTVYFRTFDRFERVFRSETVKCSEIHSIVKKKNSWFSNFSEAPLGFVSFQIIFRLNKLKLRLVLPNTALIE